jgi:hypothetical protein
MFLIVLLFEERTIFLQDEIISILFEGLGMRLLLERIVLLFEDMIIFYHEMILTLFDEVIA